MRTSDFYFDLPEALIAQHPLTNRSDSRLLVYNRKSQQYRHDTFTALVNYLKAGDLLVFNDSKVMPARLYGQKSSGGRVELLVERIHNDKEFVAHIKASKSPKPGTMIHLESKWYIEVLNKTGDVYECKSSGDIDTILTEIGHIPLPPYIARQDEKLDSIRYQTVYAKYKGSVAAPTAGLHFDEKILADLTAKGISSAYTTLHVGAGTFQPVRCEHIQDHHMHAERFTVSQSLCDAISATREAGGRVIAVGTTALRALESAATNGQLHACGRDTNIFISPGYQFQICDGLLTNFHLPESTLLMLVSAFIGYEQTMSLYNEAIAQGYRFFSYGDTSLLL